MSLANKFDSTFCYSRTLEAKQMIDMGIWSGIERHLFDNWCNQYKTDEEKILLSLLLHNLVYRSKQQVRSLILQSIDKNIPQALFNITKSETHFREINSFTSFNNYPKDFVIVPVIRDDDPPTKSGPLMARLLNRLANVNEEMMKWPWDLEALNEIKTILFIDDFVGTGNQFLNFCNKHISTKLFNSGINLLYSPLTAVTNGLDNIAKHRPEINLCPIEIVSDENNFFNAVAKEFKFDSAEVTELDGIYMSFMRKIKLHKIGGKKMVKGYGDLALTYVYEHSTPNASLPLLWANSTNYTSLFLR